MQEQSKQIKRYPSLKACTLLNNVSYIRVLLVTFILCFFNATLHSQKKACSFTLTGTVLDVDTKQPLPFVKVTVKGTEKNTLTDIEGLFEIEGLCHQSNTLIISCYGYCDTVCEDFHQHGKSPHIYLKHEVHNLEGVTITAQKSREEGTASISQQVIKVDETLVNTSQSLAATVSEVEGVTFLATGSNVQIPVIHGLYGNRVLVINNGLKHGFQNWGTDHAPEIDISAVNTATVLKGAAGVRYGPEALGGAIVVEGAPLYLNEDFKLKVGTGFHTNGRGYFINPEVSQGFNQWSYHVGANYTRVGDRHAPGYQLTNTGKEEKAFNAGLRYRIKDNIDVKLYYNYLDQNLGLLAASFPTSASSLIRAFNTDRPSIVNSFSYNINEPNHLVKHHLAKAEVNWQYSDEAKLTLRLGRQLNQRQEFDVRRNADRPIIDVDLITNDYQLEWKHPDWFHLDGLIGVQLFSQNNDNNPGTGTTAFIPNYNSLRYSAFFVESLKKNKNTFEFGVRLDYENNNVRGRETSQRIFRDDYSFSNITSSFGYIRQLSQDATFRTNIGTAWRTPNLAELYSFGQHGFGLEYGLLRLRFDENGLPRTDRVLQANDNTVQAEKGYKWINEWQKQNANNSFVLTAYGNYIENYIFQSPLGAFRTFSSATSVGFQYNQVDALFLGTDFTWKRKWTQKVEGTFGLNYLWSRNIEDKETLINQPPITTHYKLTWDLKDLGIFKSSKLVINPSYTFRQFQAPQTIPLESIATGETVISRTTGIFDFVDAPSGYFLLDLSWKFKLKSFEISISADNVLNKSYRSYLNETRYFAEDIGRNFLFTINYHI